MTGRDLELRIEVGGEPDEDALALDEATRQLRLELLELDVEDVTRPTASPPHGARASLGSSRTEGCQ